MTIGTTLLVHELKADGIPFELIDHSRTERARDEARELGLPESAVAKTLVLETPEGFVRALLPATERIDLHKVEEALELDHVHLASEATLAAAFPEFELGAVPPVAGPADRVVVDRRVAAAETVVLEAGSHETSVRLSPRDLVAAAHARVADICAD